MSHSLERAVSNRGRQCSELTGWFQIVFQGMSGSYAHRNQYLEQFVADASIVAGIVTLSPHGVFPLAAHVSLGGLWQLFVRFPALLPTARP